MAGNELLQAAFRAATDGLLIVDAGQCIARMNPAAEKLTGRQEAAALGQPWRDVLSLRAGADAAPRLQHGALPTTGTWQLELQPGGASPLPVTLRFEAIVDGNGAVVGTLLTLRPHDPVLALQSALDRSEQRLHIALERGQVGLWEWDAASDTLHEYGAWVGRTLHTATSASCAGNDLMASTHPDDIAAVRAALFAHLRGDCPYYEVEQRVRLAGGGYVRFLVRGQTVEVGANGHSARLIGTYTDVTALRAQEQLLQFALEGSQQGVWQFDLASGQIGDYGYARARLDQYELPQVLSSVELFEFLHPDDAPPLQAALLRHLRGTDAALEMEIRLRRRDGSYGHVLLRGRALERDEHGRVGRMVGTYTEISGLKTQERRLKIALENGREGLWEWEPVTESITFSPEWYAMLGYPEGSIRDARTEVAAIVHPDDLPPAVAVIRAMLKGECEDFSVEQRYRHRDGHYLHLLSRGCVLERAPDGRVLRVLGTHVDITTLKETEARLIESRRLLETVIDAFPQRVFWKDLDDHYLGGNRRFADDAGFDAVQDLAGRHVSELGWPHAAQDFLDDDKRIKLGLEDKVAVQRHFQPIRGEPFWSETTKVPLRGPDGTITGIVGMYDDISERRQRERQLEVVANALTSGRQARLLNALTRAAAELADADHAFVARLDNAVQGTVTACWPSRKPLRNWTYAMAGTPCALTVGRQRSVFSRDVRAQFPHSDMLARLQIEAYAGQQLTTADGKVIGIFALLFKHTPPDEDRVRAVLDIFAARATAELDRERTHADLLASERRLNAAMESGNQGVWEWDIESDQLLTIGPHTRRFGNDATGEAMTGRDFLAQLHPDDRPALRNALHAFFRGEQATYEREVRMQDGDGSYHWTLIRGEACDRAPDGRVTRMIGTHTDISALKQVQSALERSQDFLELVIDTVPQAIFWQDRQFRYLGCNERFAALAGVARPEDIVGKTDAELRWADSAATFIAADAPLLAGALPFLQVETRIADGRGDSRWVELVKVPMLDGAGTIIGLLGALHDITVRKEAEERANRLALYDPLTNLPNRRYFTERLEASLAAAARRGTTGALLFIDMDQFKRINDSLGHSVGDGLLQAVGQRLQNVTRQEDMVARLGGDEFVILLPDLARDFAACARQARLVAEKIHHSLGQPFQFEHHQFHVTPTIGISLFPEPGKGVDAVLKEADTAMYSGKADGRNVTRFFRPEMEQGAQQRLRIESDLRKALAGNQFELYFQPQVDAAGRVTGAEALLRWTHPEQGMIPPALFIPVAEERGLIVDIGRWVLTAAFRSYRDWLAAGVVDVGELSINVSSRQFRAEDFVDDVERLLADTGVPAHRIVLELTEGTVIEDVSATIAVMERLRRHGVKFAVDDFGVGYSSLSYLKRLPIDQLKIDRSFIADIGQDQNDEVICQTIIAMGRHLGLQTVAEGVETAAQLSFLKRLNCNRYQGYFFLRPSPAADFLRYCMTAASH